MSFTKLFRGLSFNIIILTALLLIACCPTVDQKLTVHVATWVPYKSNQILLFQNETRDTITFKVSSQERLETGHDKVCSNYTIQTAEVMLTNRADPAFFFKITLTQAVLVKFDSYYAQPPSKNLSAMFNAVSEQFVSDDWRDKYLSAIALNGKDYKNVLHLYANSPLAQTSFTELYYSKDLGLLAFSNQNGAWFYKQ